MFGAPGSGKGTQSFLLAEHEEMFHLEASKILESRMRKASPGEKVVLEGEEFFLDEQRRRWGEGLLCEDGFVAYSVKEKLKEIKDKGVIIDGYPRSIKQIESVLPFLQENFSPIDVYYIYVDKEDSVYRNSNRKVCTLMRHSIMAHEETAHLSICPLDGSPLKKRKLDDPEVIETRLEEFQESTLPVLNYLRENGVEVKEVDGRGSIADVFSRILSL